ncbi:MAG: CheY-like chemotaxis protein, partial [Oleiphilaceae bacterium]
HSVELQASNQYKSEFLANMSHELRTPLNSLLILAGLLAKNKQGTLTEDQVDSAQVIQKSGQHLLQLINDILDLSKIEAGHMDVTIAPTEIPLLSQALQQRFTPLVKEKSLDFNVVMVNELPDDFKTDAQKLEQILTNLISNAIKFTQQGEIRLEVSYQKEAELFPGQPYCVCFSVIDSGIGIAKEQQERIFGAFQQVDGSNRRKQGGTGLGLSIALAYAHILGGHLKCQSKMGKGSQFDLYIPEVPPVNQIMSYHAPAITEPEYHESISNEPVSAAPFPDDRDDIGSDDLVILVLEDDIEFAKILYREAKQKGYKCIVSDDAESTLKLALQHQVSGILLDFCLPNMDGKAFLDKMKRIPAIRYIPVHVISVLEDTKDYWKQGVVGYLTKPVSQAQIVEALDCISQFSPTAIRHLLIVEDDKDTQQALVKLLRNDNVEIDTASTVKDALQVLKTEHCDCLILDIGLPDGSGFDLLDAIELETNLKLPPLIVYTAKELTPEETQNLRQYTDSIIIKTKHSTERLKDETALFLHQAREKKVEPALEAELLVEFSNKTLLLVDDDMRNSLALNKVLKELGIIVTMVTSGQDALDKLAEDNIFNWVIMDIMMPDMDGYETMRRIRAQDRFKYLPLLAITAKAMKGDKEKCLEAGASDYLSKPIDINKLTQLLHVWISK